jgi:hypothetical protein
VKHLHLITELQRIISEWLILLTVTAMRTSKLFTGTTNIFVGRVGGGFDITEHCKAQYFDHTFTENIFPW